MDLASFRRARNRASGRSSATVDFGMLTASLQAMQGSTATALAQSRVRGEDLTVSAGQAALVELLLAGPGWEAAVEAQEGSFNTRYARERRGNA